MTRGTSLLAVAIVLISIGSFQSNRADAQMPPPATIARHEAALNAPSVPEPTPSTPAPGVPSVTSGGNCCLLLWTTITCPGYNGLCDAMTVALSGSSGLLINRNG